MKVTVFGYRTMLGLHITNILRRCGHIYIAADCRYEDVAECISVSDAVVNCAGARTSTLDMLRVNAMFPVLLAAATNKPIINISTDRVFSGNSSYKYRANDLPDPLSIFGRSKLLGEVYAPHVLNVRTSFVGCDRGMATEVDRGFKNVKWSGSTVNAVARAIVRMLIYWPGSGICHLATEQSISRYDAAILLGHNPTPEYYPVRNFALVPTVVLPPFAEAIKEWVR